MAFALAGIGLGCTGGAFIFCCGTAQAAVVIGAFGIDEAGGGLTAGVCDVGAGCCGTTVQLDRDTVSSCGCLVRVSNVCVLCGFPSDVRL